MVVSLHLARHTPAAAVRGLLSVERRSRELRREPGLCAGRACWTSNLQMATPDRMALFCAWESAVAADAFRAHSPLLESFCDGAREARHFKLEPVRVRDSWRGWEPDTSEVEPLAPDEPLAAFVYARLRPRYMPTFVRANLKAERFARRQPGYVGGLGVHEGPRRFASFSVWRSLDAVQRFAYQPGDHRPVIKPSMNVPWGHEQFSARLRPLSARDGWDDLVAALAR